MDTSTQMEIIKTLAAQYGVRVIFADDDEAAGYANVASGEVVICPGNCECPLATFLHEVGHVLCYRLGKFPTYHKRILRTWREVAVARRQALAVELWADRWAERVYVGIAVGGKYPRCYRDQREKNALRNYLAGLRPGMTTVA